MKHEDEIIIAIDPGSSGGIVVYCNDKMTIYAMPSSHTDLVEILGQFRHCASKVLCMVEDVPRFVSGITTPSSMAKLHYNFGYLVGIIDTMGFRLKLVRPQDWQKAVSAGSKKDYGTKWKAHLKDIARRRFPELGAVVTLKTADALLILSTYLDKQTNKKEHKHE
jgi:hypothetical protein